MRYAPGSMHFFIYKFILYNKYKFIKDENNMNQCPMGTFLYAIKPGDSLWVLAQRYNTDIQTILDMNPGIHPNQLYIGQVINICQGYDYQMTMPMPMPMPSERPFGGIMEEELNLINALRALWEQHVEWTRMDIISAVEGLADSNLVSKRLLRNPKDFAALLEPLYGAQNASKFEKLFTEHLVIASELVRAAKAGDKRTADETEKKWYANAEEIAVFLNSINPYWTKDAFLKMLNEHLALTKQEAVERIKKNYASDIETYDKIEKQALVMADEMAEGIVRQFPDRF